MRTLCATMVGGARLQSFHLVPASFTGVSAETAMQVLRVGLRVSKEIILEYPLLRLVYNIYHLYRVPHFEIMKKF